MTTINICGKRGLGDILSTISLIIGSYKIEGHYIFHYPPGFDYTNTIAQLMSEYVPPSGLNITHEVDETFYSVRPNVCDRKFGIENLNKTYFFSVCKNHNHAPVVSKWVKNDGPIGLSLNCSNNNEFYPYREKFFPDDLNNQLNALVDEKNFVTLGRPYSVAESIQKMARCRYIVGIDGAWAHMAKSVGVPYILIRNGISRDLLLSMHSKSRNIKIIETAEIGRFIPQLRITP